LHEEWCSKVRANFLGLLRSGDRPGTSEDLEAIGHQAHSLFELQRRGLERHPVQTQRHPQRGRPAVNLLSDDRATASCHRPVSGLLLLVLRTEPRQISIPIDCLRASAIDRREGLASAKVGHRASAIRSPQGLHVIHSQPRTEGHAFRPFQKTAAAKRSPLCRRPKRSRSRSPLSDKSGHEPHRLVSAFVAQPRKTQAVLKTS
jgi:hypothetical protein